MIFDNPVVDDGEKTVHRSMGVSVRVIWFPVGSPASMSHTDRCAGVFQFHVMFQVLHPSLALVNLDVIIMDQRDSGRVISPVFQAFQTVN